MTLTPVVLTNAARAKCFRSLCRSRRSAITHQILNLNCVLSLEPKWRSMELGKQHQQGPQNSYPISARGLEGFNIPHLGRIVHHAVQTPQNVPLATASTTKSCRAFFYFLSLHRSFVVKHAGFDCTKSETFIHQSKHTSICRCIQYTIVTSFDHQRTVQLPHLRIAQLSSINGLAAKVHQRGLLANDLHISGRENIGE